MARLRSEMNKKLAYQQITFPFQGDPLIVASRIAESAGYEDYILYEYSDEWSLGLGVHSRVTVYHDRTVLHTDGGERTFAHAGADLAIDTALSHVGVEGWRAYGTADFELSRFLYRLELQEPEKPLIRIFIPEAEVRLSRETALLRTFERQTLDALRDHVESVLGGMDGDLQRRAAGPRLDPSSEIDTHDAEVYKSRVSVSLTEIRRHDYRKVILSRAVPLSQDIDIVASYVAGRQANTPARSFMLKFDGLEAAGFSPETIVEVTDNREVFTTPLAGTRAIGEDAEQEMRLREELVSDSKEIAEHAISVYVAFDEMTMMCDPRTVSVSNFMLVSRRGSVQHLASRLTGKLLNSADSWYAFNALFPAVTVSGVPKMKSIDAIGRHEPGPRGLYSGCVMIYDHSGKLDAAVVLRSFFRQNGQTWLQAGAGIMNMSNPERELEETCEKLRSCSRHLVAANA